MDNLAAIHVRIELEERDEHGKVRNRVLSNPVVFYASAIPGAVTEWLEKTLKMRTGKESA